MRTDRHDEASSRFSQFCERVLKKYNSFHFKMLPLDLNLSQFNPLHVHTFFFSFFKGSVHTNFPRGLFFPLYFPTKFREPVSHFVTQCLFFFTSLLMNIRPTSRWSVTPMYISVSVVMFSRLPSICGSRVCQQRCLINHSANLPLLYCTLTSCKNMCIQI